MTLSVRHGRRILKKPFNEALDKWLISVVLFPQMCAIITSLLLMTMNRFTLSSATSAPTRPTSTSLVVANTSTTSTNPYVSHWPLRYHFSEWLQREFVEDYRSDQMCELTRRTDKCQTSTSNIKDKNTISDQNMTVFDNVSANSLPSNGSALKTIQTIVSNEMTTESLTLLGPGASDGSIATSASAAPNFMDSLLVSNNQCLFLDGKSAKSICDSQPGQTRFKLLEQYHLKYCDRYPLSSVLRYEPWQSLLHNHSIDSQKCEQILSELVMIDNIVNHLICEYNSLLERYDCQDGFSVIWTCDDCRKVYREWVCSMLIPFHLNGSPMKPCRAFCERVEQRCPHLHPYGKGQYAGEPVFLCIDPNIPINPSITPITPYGDPKNCYDTCNLLNSEQNSVSNSDDHNSQSKEERIDCISNSELYNNYMAKNVNTTLATVTESSAANH